MDERNLRREFVEILAAYLRGEISIQDLRSWEAEYSLDPAVGPLREDLDRVALVSEEVVDDVRQERELREVAAEVLARQSLRLLQPAPHLETASRSKTFPWEVDTRSSITIKTNLAVAGDR